MERTLKYGSAFAALLVIMFAVVIPATAADNAKVAGEWKFTVESPNGTGTPTVTFKQDGETLTGTYKGRLGELPLNGTIKGNDIKFSVKASIQGQDLQIDYTGQVDGDSMKGKINFGGMAEGSFTGNRAEAAK
ncbi:MAG TPA: hypothetical protein VFC07_14265 [Verrucomicrobiae bacterium]|nr:hypothetical protein [Verrucomicrobiae bacterium]